MVLTKGPQIEGSTQIIQAGLVNKETVQLAVSYCKHLDETSLLLSAHFSFSPAVPMHGGYQYLRFNQPPKVQFGQPIQIYCAVSDVVL